MNLTFPEAMAELAERAGVELPKAEVTPQARQEAEPSDEPQPEAEATAGKETKEEIAA